MGELSELPSITSEAYDASLVIPVTENSHAFVDAEVAVGGRRELFFGDLEKTYQVKLRTKETGSKRLNGGSASALDSSSSTKSSQSKSAKSSKKAKKAAKSAKKAERKAKVAGKKAEKKA